MAGMAVGDQTFENIATLQVSIRRIRELLEEGYSFVKTKSAD